MEFLLRWYAQQCDGDWEHRFGIDIRTLDNPGWSLKIDLVGTPLQGRKSTRRVVERSEHDWIQLWSNGQAFEAACGPLNLLEAALEFERFASAGDP
jgi:hypothetical protein